MHDAALLVAELICDVIGFACLALAMSVHWQQVLGEIAESVASKRALRAAGIAALAVALILCLTVNHATIAALVWVMSLAAGALIVAFTLTWWPRLLTPLARLAVPRQS